MIFDIISAEYISNYSINLKFEDGSSGIVDLSSYSNPDNVFKAFLDLNYFMKFKIEHGTLVWGTGELDIAPETLYQKATGKEIDYSSWKNVV